MPERHFAFEPDAVEHYVLGTMEGEEQRACDKHVRECAKCAEAVRAERVVAAGARRLAREELKSRLSSRLSKARTSSVPWPRILAVAAIVTTVLGIGYLSGWFQLRRDEVPVGETTGVETKLNLPSQSETRDQHRTAATAAKEEPSAPVRISELPPADMQTGGGKLEHPSEKMKIEMKKSEPVAQAGEEISVISDARMAESTVTIRIPVQAWASGEVRFEDEGKREKSDEGKGQSMTRSRVDVQAVATPQAAPPQVVMKSVPAPRYVVEQQTVGELPPAQRSLSATAERRIPVLLEDRDGTVRIVLFLDPPLSSSSLQGARVSEVGSDSLVVRLPGRSIVFEIPSSFTASRVRR